MGLLFIAMFVIAVAAILKGDESGGCCSRLAGIGCVICSLGFGFFLAEIGPILALIYMWPFL